MKRLHLLNRIMIFGYDSKNTKKIFKVVKNQGDIVKDFFDILSPKIHELNSGFYFMIGMHDYNTAELIITAYYNQ